jgi:hypothetical protein
MSVALQPVIKEIVQSGASAALMQTLLQRLSAKTPTSAVKGKPNEIKAAFKLLSGYAGHHGKEAIELVRTLDADHQTFLLSLADQYADQVDSEVLKTIMQEKTKVTTSAIDTVGKVAIAAIGAGAAVLVATVAAGAYEEGKRQDNKSLFERIFG